MLGSSLTTTTIILTRPPSSPPSCLPMQTLSLPCPSPPLRDVGWSSCLAMEGYAGRRYEGGPKTWEAQHGGRRRLAPLSSLEGCVPARSRSMEGYGMEGHQQELGRRVRHETSHDVRHGSFSSFLIPDPTLTTRLRTSTRRTMTNPSNSRLSTIVDTRARESLLCTA